jgi:hypothetical protein
MFPQWLQSTATVADLETENLVNGVPFGFCNGEWEAMKAAMLPGDELWRFSSPSEDWERLMGWEGVALVRHGEVVSCVVTGMN